MITTLNGVASYAGYAYIVFQATKDIPLFQKLYSKGYLTAPPEGGPSSSATNSFNNTNTTYTTQNKTFNYTQIAPTFMNDPQKVEETISFIDMLISSAPAVGHYATLLSCAVQFVHGQQAIAELRKLNGHLGRSADAVWGKFSFGDEFPQHVHEFVLNEMKHSMRRNPPKEKGLISECFFVFNKGNQWWPKFERLCEENPLPDGFFGCFTNLDVLITLIRDVLRPAMGPDLVFVILMPTQSNTLSVDPVMLPQGMGPLRFKGELQANGESCVYMNLCRLQGDQVLDGVENFPKNSNSEWKYFARWATLIGITGPSMFACVGLLSIPVIGLPLTAVAWIGCTPRITLSAVEAVDKAECWKIKVRTLGSQETQSYQPWELE
ncbi:uncharacterized protein FRV6_16550 [Fusarium oxysporum]|uniref:Uncharacterized protein n=1 Tax=Fusarium oxysporum TaxID=5507 RepID=A0A2H3TUY6_FUSOX|nr:uncharacterized protein FRV6_16550 [Fusarium oxysporum]